MITEIPLNIRLTEHAQARLAERAKTAGKSVSEYVSTLVESFVETPRTIAEISGPVYQRFLNSGTTDEQLSEELEHAKHEMRAERSARQAS